MDWRDGPALIGWGGKLTPEEERRMNRSDALRNVGCVLLLLLIVGTFGIGLYTISRWLDAWL